MNLKYILIVWGAMLFCVGCSEDDVDSSYSFDVAGLKATVTNDKGSPDFITFLRHYMARIENQ